MSIARLNRAVTNPLVEPVARRVRPLAVIEHHGRATGTRYRTPVLTFRSGETFAFALTYGKDVDWVKNVLAADGCRLIYKGRSIDLGSPKLGGAELSAPVPSWIRSVLSMIDVDDYLTMTER